MIEIFAIVAISLIIIIYLTLILLWNFNFKTYSKTGFSELPKVSILIACRNEASNVSELITNLLKLAYPKDKLEILIGNDASEDSTLELLETINEAHIHIFDISTNINELKGKMNVLAQLAQKSSGDFLLMTDADMQHSPHWIHSLLEACDENTGIVAGFTLTDSNNLTSNFQQIDYLFGQAIMKVLIDLGKPIYISGNNLLIRKKAYDAAGGYENMPFHLTEDVLILNAIVKKGYNIKAQFKAASISTTNALNSLLSIIHQRKRWMHAFDLMPYWVIIFPLLRLVFIPVSIFLLFINPEMAILLLVIKVFINLGFTFVISHRLALKPNYFTAAFYDFYELIIYLPALVLRWLSNIIIWKNRKL